MTIKTRTRAEIRRSIESEHRYHAETLSSIRGDKTLSKLGQQRQLQQEHQRHTTAISTLKVESDAADAATQAAALKALFTLPYRYGESEAERRATQASYRQAVLHAASLADERQAR